jgi:hypothetical protein
VGWALSIVYKGRALLAHPTITIKIVSYLIRDRKQRVLYYSSKNNEPAIRKYKLSNDDSRRSMKNYAKTLSQIQVGKIFKLLVVIPGHGKLKTLTIFFAIRVAIGAGFERILIVRLGESKRFSVFYLKHVSV